MHDVLKELGFRDVRTEYLSDQEQTALRILCEEYVLASTDLDRNDLKRKIKKLLHDHSSSD